MDHMVIYSCSVSKKSWIKSLGAAAVTLTVTCEPVVIPQRGVHFSDT